MPTTPPLPPLPEPATAAYVQGRAMQGGEYRDLAADYDEYSARYSVRHMHAYALAYLEADRRSRAPDGWVCVPRKPTEAMQYAAERAFAEWSHQCDLERDFDVPFTKDTFKHSDSYRAMIAAVPAAQPPADALATAKSLAWDELEERQREVYLAYAASAPVAQPPATAEAVALTEWDLRQGIPEAIQVAEDALKPHNVKIIDTIRVNPRFFLRIAHAALATQPPAPVLPTEAVAGEASEDTKRLDWLDAASNEMLLEFGFEMDGGVYLRIDAPGHGGTDIREKSTARQLIDSAMVVAPC